MRMPEARGSRVPAWPMRKGRLEGGSSSLGGRGFSDTGLTSEVAGVDCVLFWDWVEARRGAKRVEVRKVDWRVRRRAPEEMPEGLEIAVGGSVWRAILGGLLVLGIYDGRGRNYGHVHGRKNGT